MPQPLSQISSGAFENLAPELLTPILFYLPDLESLDSLLQASPAASRLFNLRSVEIFDSILSSDTTIHKYTRALIHITILLKQTALPLHVYDLTSFKDMVRHETTAYRYKPSRWAYPPSTIPSYTSTATLREVLSTDRKLRRLALDCLQYYLDKFQPLRPSCPADRQFRYKAIFKEKNNFEGPWRQNPAEIPYPVQTLETPSWIEQQRVIRALWHIRLFYEFKDAIGTSCITWPEEDISEAWKIGLEDFYDVPKYLPSGAYLMNADLYEDSGPIAFNDTLLEDELVRSVLDYLAEDRKPISISTYFQLKASWEPPLVPPIEHEWNWESLDKCNNSPMWQFFYSMSGRASCHETDSGSPLQHVPFLPFRRLGFAIWCRLRLSRYGFLSDLDRQTDELRNPFESASLYTAWRSVLTAEERASADKYNEEMDCKLMNAPVQSFEEFEDLRRQREADQAMQLEFEEEEEPEPVFGLDTEYILRNKSAKLRIREEEESQGGHDW